MSYVGVALATAALVNEDIAYSWKRKADAKATSLDQLMQKVFKIKEEDTVASVKRAAEHYNKTGDLWKAIQSFIPWQEYSEVSFAVMVAEAVVLMAEAMQDGNE